MGRLPPDIVTIISMFAPLFAERVWSRAQALLVGAILTPGRRTVAAVLRVPIPWAGWVWARPFLTLLCPSDGMNLVTPGNPSQSYLYHKMANTHLAAGGCGGTMPFGGAPSQAELELVEQWIQEGAQP